MIKNSEIAEGSTSKNIDKARQKLAVMNMTEEKRKAYNKYLINLAKDRDVVDTAKEEGREAGREEGREIGREEGREEGIYETVKNSIIEGLTYEIIKKITKLTDEQINKIRDELKNINSASA